ncbi:hypothetical protein HUX88_22510 [Duganella sp. BJB1802]|uniref:hypothetical protein n=1 Tax=Duganella sp. BJB1802 TaxID=2744575 RepID=UPI00159353C3|nr:hypothetical protein [Duganella sp. BJB1802]NVD73290.1 hypothetical protein [Duganella sp. BJB1802]
MRFDHLYKTFDSVVEAVAVGKADVARQLSRLGRTLKRAQMVHFSISYINGPRDADQPHALRPAGRLFRTPCRRWCATTPARWACWPFVVGGVRPPQLPKAKLVQYPTWPDLIEATKKGEVTATTRRDGSGATDARGRAWR